MTYEKTKYIGVFPTSFEANRVVAPIQIGAGDDSQKQFEMNTSLLEIPRGQ